MEKSRATFPCFMLQYNDRWKIFHDIIVIGWKVFHLSTLLDAIEMDLRELVRSHSDMFVGHKPIKDSLNFRIESQRFGKDPMKNLIKAIWNEDASFLLGDIQRYLQAYSWYSLCLKRCLEHISVARRGNAGLRYHPKNGKYSKHQKQIAHKRNTISPYLELDYQNLIIHACILLDRTITISRRFISGKSLPSFTSFNKHMVFLSKNPGALGNDHKDYEDELISSLKWYRIPIKVLRDKYLMHSSEKHMAFFGWGESNWDLELITVVSAKSNQIFSFEGAKWICFTPRQLARDIESFLSWFSKYWQRMQKASNKANTADAKSCAAD